jgi:chromosome partitioning protein
MEKAGRKVLVVDCDPQANATLGLGVNPETLGRTMYDVFMSRVEGFPAVAIPEIVIRTRSGIPLAPASLDLVGVEPYLYGIENRAFILKDALSGLDTAYDFILIDTPPSMGQFVINGVVAADHCIVTLDSGIFAMHGVDALTTIFTDIRETFGREVTTDMIILTRWAAKAPPEPVAVPEETGLLSRLKRILMPGPPEPAPEERRRREEEMRERERLSTIENDVKKRFKTVFSVPYSTDIYEAQRQGLPVSHYAPESVAAQCYKDIADEVMRWN